MGLVNTELHLVECAVVAVVADVAGVADIAAAADAAVAGVADNAAAAAPAAAVVCLFAFGYLQLKMKMMIPGPIGEGAS